MTDPSLPRPSGPDTDRPLELATAVLAAEPETAAAPDGEGAVRPFTGPTVPVDGPAEPVSSIEAAPSDVGAMGDGDVASNKPSPATEPEPSASDLAEASERSPASSTGGMTGLLGSGLLGGLVGAGLALAAQALWLSPAGRTDERLAQLEQRAGAANTAQDTAATLDRRLVALETELKAQSDRLRVASEAADGAARRAEVAVNRPPPPPDPAQAAALAQTQTRLEALDRTSGERANAAREALAALERKAAEQDGRIASLTRQLSEAGPQRLDAIARMVAADGVQSALRDGRGLGAYLPALDKLKTPAPILAALQPYRDAPAPNAAALARDFKPIAETIAAGQRQQPSDWSGRLMGIAGEIVSIRPIEGSADAPGAAGRIEAALARGDLASAAAAFDTLPEPARRSAAAFGDSLRKRAGAEAAARQLSGEALASFEAASR